MANDKIQLGSLEFEDIKQSIIEFMTTQRTGSAAELKDYDFEGSALQTLIEILAYNTLYYGHYSNMIANEMFLDTAQKSESMISLVKPLGYVVPGYSSAVAEIRIISGGANITIPKYSSFIGQDSNGASFVFYTKEISFLDSQGKGNVELAEGKTFVSNEIELIDSKGFLTGIDIDISTLTVEVKDSDDNWNEWSLASNIEYNIDENSEVYWLERSEFGFFVVFGGTSASGSNTIIGSVPDSGTVRVKYLISSGEKGNGVSSFRFNNLYGVEDTLSSNHQIVGIKTSSEGNDEPDLEAIRFFAPKWFATQGRAVTKSDCKAVLASKGFSEDASTIWGGEEMSPPMYGRLFVSLIGEEDSAGIAISALKEKTCVTILPEYISPEYYDINLNVNVHYDVGDTDKSYEQMIDQVVIFINEMYGRTRFGNNLDIQPIISGLLALDSAYRISEDSFEFTLDYANSNDNTTQIIKFFNPITSETNTSVVSNGIVDNTLNDEEIFLEDNQGIIQAYNIQNGLKVIIDNNVGTVNYTNGVIKLKNISNESYTLSVKLEDNLSVKAPENMVLRITPNVTLTAI